MPQVNYEIMKNVIIGFILFCMEGTIQGCSKLHIAANPATLTSLQMP